MNVGVNRYPRQQSGVALMIVILVFALVSILAVGMYNRQSIFIQTSANIFAQTQAYEYALASEIYGRRLLKADWDDDKEAGEMVDDLEEIQSSILVPVDDAFLEAQFNDVHGKLNLNDLVDLAGSANALMVDRFKALFNRLDINSLKVEKIQDWIDEDQQPKNIDGAEDGEYLVADPPFRNAGQPFTHLSELRLIDGITSEDIEKLSDHVCVLPQGKAAINVNTATPEVLQSIVSGLSDQEAESLVAARDKERWKDTASFKADPLLGGKTVDVNYLGVNSSFYEIATKITLSDRVVRLVSLVYREGTKGDMTVVYRDQGQKYLITKDKIEL